MLTCSLSIPDIYAILFHRTFCFIIAYISTVRQTDARWCERSVTQLMGDFLPDCGIKSALCVLGCPPIWCIGGNRCVPGRTLTPPTRCNTPDFVPKSVCSGVKPLWNPCGACTHIRRKMAKFHYIRVFFHGGVWYTRLSSTNRNL